MVGSEGKKGYRTKSGPVVKEKQAQASVGKEGLPEKYVHIPSSAELFVKDQCEKLKKNHQELFDTHKELLADYTKTHKKAVENKEKSEAMKFEKQGLAADYHKLHEEN
ncbi:unnamed protein product, partial [Amoebophrya sp. A120]|eukprot:GSA120T00022844001.1